MFFIELKFYPYDYNANVRRRQIVDDRLQNQEIVHYKQQVLKQSVPPSTGGPVRPTEPDTPTDPETPGGGGDRPEIE